MKEAQRLQQLRLTSSSLSHVLENGTNVRHRHGAVIILLQHIVETAAEKVHRHAVVPVELKLVKSENETSRCRLQVVAVGRVRRVSLGNVARDLGFDLCALAIPADETMPKSVPMDRTNHLQRIDLVCVDVPNLKGARKRSRSQNTENLVYISKKTENWTVPIQDISLLPHEVATRVIPVAIMTRRVMRVVRVAV